MGIEENKAMDAKVLETIKKGVHRSAGTIARALGVKDYREVDRSLQRIRKRGFIEFVGHTFGWKAVL